MITFLNDKEDSQLRISFYENIVGVAAFVGHECSPILLPLLQQVSQICLFVCLFVYLYACLSVYMSVSTSNFFLQKHRWRRRFCGTRVLANPSSALATSKFVLMFVCLSVCLSVCLLSVCLFIYLYTCLSVCIHLEFLSTKTLLVSRLLWDMSAHRSFFRSCNK
jgi:hypothetical protein